MEYKYINVGKCKDLNKIEFYMSELRDRVISKNEWMVLEDIMGADKSKTNKWEESRLLLVYLLHTQYEQQLSSFLQAYITSDLSSDYVFNYNYGHEACGRRKRDG